MITVAQMRTETWIEWQHGVVAVLRHEFHDVLEEIRIEDVDWESWKSFFDEGRSPRNAVARAFVRDL